MTTKQKRVSTRAHARDPRNEFDTLYLQGIWDSIAEYMNQEMAKKYPDVALDWKVKVIGLKDSGGRDPEARIRELEAAIESGRKAFHSQTKALRARAERAEARVKELRSLLEQAGYGGILEP